MIRSCLIVALLVGVSANCDGYGSDRLEWQGTLQGLPGWEHLSGEAAFRWTEGQQQFTSGITIAGDQPGAIRPWHVHFNTCAVGGGIVGGDTQYPRLTIGPGGTSAQVANVSFTPSSDAAYHVNVHLSAAEMATIIACADLTLEGGQGGGSGQPNIPGY